MVNPSPRPFGKRKESMIIKVQSTVINKINNLEEIPYVSLVSNKMTLFYVIGTPFSILLYLLEII